MSYLCLFGDGGYPAARTGSSCQQVCCSTIAPPAHEPEIGSQGGPLKIYSLKRNAIPKIAVLVTGLTAAVLVATINPTPAQAHVGYTEACDSCHDAGGSVTATPSSATVAPGATYTVALAFTGGGSPSGYWISGNGVNATGSSSTSA